MNQINKYRVNLACNKILITRFSCIPKDFFKYVELNLKINIVLITISLLSTFKCDIFLKIVDKCRFEQYSFRRFRRKHLYNVFCLFFMCISFGEEKAKFESDANLIKDKRKNCNSQYVRYMY